VTALRRGGTTGTVPLLRWNYVTACVQPHPPTNYVCMVQSTTYSIAITAGIQTQPTGDYSWDAVAMASFKESAQSLFETIFRSRSSSGDSKDEADSGQHQQVRHGVFWVWMLLYGWVAFEELEPHTHLSRALEPVAIWNTGFCYPLQPLLACMERKGLIMPWAATVPRSWTEFTHHRWDVSMFGWC